jgi:hypothetical protein
MKKFKPTTKAARENERRKRQARETLNAYAEITKQQRETDETNLCDLLADCMHLMGREAVEGRLFMAGEHYKAEAKGEE